MTLTFTGNYTVEKNVIFIPATNVLYEENLITHLPIEVEGVSVDNWELTGTALTDTVVDDNDSTIYGYTDADTYAVSEEFSDGSAYMAELTLEADKTTTRTSNAATFTFTGTGFDLISECGTDTGMLVVRVDDSTGKAVKAFLVDTYFTGDDEYISAGEKGILDYQVPVVRVMDLPYGTYTVNVFGYLINTAGAVTARAYSLDADEDSTGISQEDAVIAALDDLGMDDIDPSDVEVAFMDDNSVLNGEQEM